MKKVILFMLLCCLSWVVIGKVEMEQKEMVVGVENIKASRGGQLIVFVFFEDGFPKDHDKAVRKIYKLVVADKDQFSIRVPVNKPFALKVLHDANMDGKVTKNWTGIIPYDGVGFSNSARIRFGVPSYSDAVMHYQKQTRIRLRYF